MVEMFQFGQEAIEQFEFARRPVEVGAGHEAAWDAHVLAICLFDMLEHEGVIAELPQLHNRVHQGLGASSSLLVLFRSVRQHHAFALHVLVMDLLQARHVALDDVLDLVGQLRFDFFLQAAAEERAQDFVQTANDQNRFFFVQLHLFAGRGERRVEPLLESRHRFEDGRQKKVEQSPQFRQFVLEGRARQKQTVRRQIVRVQHLEKEC